MDIKKLNKIYNSIKNGMSLKDLQQLFECGEVEIRGIIELLNIYGKEIELTISDNNDIVINKRIVRKSQKKLKPDIEDCIHKKLLIISDTHFGNNFQQLHLVNELYGEAYEREIDTVLHVGDVLDGDYSSIRKEQARQVFLHGFDEQAGYVCDMYPKIDGIKTLFILGSHDETHYKNGGATLGCWIPRARKDMIYLGQDQVTIDINGVKITLDHPGDGSSYALSYKPQKRIEELESGNKPKLLLMGHYHKSYQFVYRNVHCLQVPCLCGKTQFQTKKGLSNIIGGYFVDIYSDEKGNIQYFNAEERIFNHNDLWDEVGKDAHRVRQLIK